MGIIVEIWTYPVKGCAGVALAEAELTPAGVRHDREFMVTDPSGLFRSQRRSPKLAVIRPSVVGDELHLAADGVEPLAVPVVVDGPRRDVLLFTTGYPAVDQGDEAAAWLSEALGEPSRLVRVPPDHDRVVPGTTPGTSGWADSAALHLLTTASLADFTARATAPVAMSRFRPNIVVDDLGGPYAEDRVLTATLGTATLGFSKPAIRCAVTLVDQEAGAKAGPEPLRTLSTYRRHPDRGVTFGTKFSVTTPGTITLGDPFTVTTWTYDEAPPPGGASHQSVGEPVSR